MNAIVLATPQEASPLLSQTKLEPVHDAPFPMYMLPNEDGIVLICGLGKRAAAEAMRYLFDNYAVQQVLNIGICGALTDSVTPHDLYRVSSVGDGDAAQSPASIPLQSDMFSDLPTATLTSVSKPVFDTKRRNRLAACAMLVDMEGVAIAIACRERNVPCCIVKGVSDRADAQGRRSLRKNLSAISRRLANRAVSELGWPRRKIWRLEVFRRFVRIEHTVLSIPLILAGAWLGAGHRMPSLRDVLLLTLVGAGGRTLGMAMS